MRRQRADASAHRALYDTHVKQIYRLTYRLLGTEHPARDNTQNAIAVSLSLNEIRRRRAAIPARPIFFYLCCGGERTSIAHPP